MIHNLIIDTTTASKEELMRRLKQESFTVDCRDGGAYHDDPMLSKIELQSHLDEYTVEDWLHQQRGVDCFGVTSL